jgi:flagellar biosynthesis/type III secretory pathway chaperone
MLNEQINAYVKYLKSGSETLQSHNLTNGFMLTLDNNFDNMSGFLLFLNRNRSGNLSDLKALLNH